MDVDDAAGDLHGAGKRDRDIADADGNRIPVDDDEAALRVHDQPRSVVVALGDAGYGVRHVERDHDQRRRERRQQRTLELRKLSRADFLRLRRRPGRQALAVPDSLRIVTLAVMSGKPAAVHAQRAQLAAVRIVYRDEAYGRAVAVAELPEPTFQVGEAVDFVPVHHRDDGAARDACSGEYVAGICHVRAAHRYVEMPRLLI